MVVSPFSPVTVAEVNVTKAVLECMKLHPSRTALVDGVTGESETYHDLHQSIRCVASGLHRLGLQRGDIVALISPNSSAFIHMMFGVIANGAAATTINPSYTPYELSHPLANAKVGWIFTTPPLIETVQEALKLAKLTVSGIIVTGTGTRPPSTVPYSSLLADDGSWFPENLFIDVHDDSAIIPYSSGTTGLPKGVMLTHYNVVAMVTQMCHEALWDGLHDIEEQTVLLPFLPFFHVYGMIGVMMTGLVTGAKLVILERFHLEIALQCIEKYKVTVLHLIPPVLIVLNNSPLVSKYNLKSLKRINSGAAPLGISTEFEASQKLKTQTIVQGYGMTETTTTCLYNPPGSSIKKPGSVGLPLPNTEIQISDVSTGRFLGANERGEVLVKGPQVMKGYLYNKEATDQIIDTNGWLHTGDIGYYDEDGYFYIVDRIKELIKYKGFQVAPAELEELLLTHPEVADVAVIGIPDTKAGEVPKAFVVKGDLSLTEEQVKQFVAEKVSHFKHLRGGVEFIDKIPKSVTGKILRRQLRDRSATTSKL